MRSARRLRLRLLPESRRLAPRVTARREYRARVPATRDACHGCRCTQCSEARSLCVSAQRLTACGARRRTNRGTRRSRRDQRRRGMARAIDGHSMSAATPERGGNRAAVRLPDLELHGGDLDRGDRAHRLRAGGDAADDRRPGRGAELPRVAAGVAVQFSREHPRAPFARADVLVLRQRSSSSS